MSKIVKNNYVNLKIYLPHSFKKHTFVENSVDNVENPRFSTVLPQKSPGFSTAGIGLFPTFSPQRHPRLTNYGNKIPLTFSAHFCRKSFHFFGSNRTLAISDKDGEKTLLKLNKAPMYLFSSRGNTFTKCFSQEERHAGKSRDLRCKHRPPGPVNP